MGGDNFNIEKLNHDNYIPWSFKMKMFLMKEGVWDAVSSLKPDEVKLSDWNFKEQKSLQIIVLGCENNQLIHLKKCETGLAAWNALKGHHQQSTLGARIRVMKKNLPDAITTRRLHA